LQVIIPEANAETDEDMQSLLESLSPEVRAWADEAVVTASTIIKVLYYALEGRGTYELQYNTSSFPHLPLMITSNIDLRRELIHHSLTD